MQTARCIFLYLIDNDSVCSVYGTLEHGLSLRVEVDKGVEELFVVVITIAREARKTTLPENTDRKSSTQYKDHSQVHQEDTFSLANFLPVHFVAFLLAL